MTTDTETMGSEGPEGPEDRLREIKQKALDDARAGLEKFGFDAIVLMATYTTEDGFTAGIHANSGNWYAQNGLMQRSLDGRRRDNEMDAEDRRRGDDA